jgi:hypothetical protein
MAENVQACTVTDMNMVNACHASHVAIVVVIIAKSILQTTAGIPLETYLRKTPPNCTNVAH